MSDDITSTKPAESAAAAEHTIEEKLEEAKEKFEEVAKAATETKETSGDSEAVKKDKSSEEGDHTLLGDLWKGAKKWFQPK